MQDYNRGIIIGQNTFGKGTVQQSRSLNFVYDLDQTPLGVLQYTIQKFYRINGGSTQLKGVAADINFPEIIDAKEIGEEKKIMPYLGIKFHPRLILKPIKHVKMLKH